MSIILQDFSPAQIPLALDANQIAFWQLFFSRSPQAKLHNDSGILWVETAIRHDIFNRVLHTNLHPNTAPAAIEQVFSYFRQRRIPFLWHIGPSSQPDHLASLLESYGAIHYETEPGIAVDLHKINEEAVAISQLTTQRVTTQEELEQWIRVWEYENSEELIRLWQTFYLKIYREDSLHLYLGTLHGKPVATSGVFFSEGVASIGPVGTLPAYRRQGIGTAMTLTALRQARTHGYRIAVLTASPMGINTYRRIGFQQYGTVSIYLWHPNIQARKHS
jgi:ribosomal protein S18 acetylase RimI-like enzyme